MVTAHARGLFPARMRNKNCCKYSKNLFYNVKIITQRDLCLLLVPSNSAENTIFFPQQDRFQGSKDFQKSLSRLAWEPKWKQNDRLKPRVALILYCEH